MNIETSNNTYINQANIDNLIDLWKRYGYQKTNATLGLNTNTYWPHRCWFDKGLSSSHIPELRHLKNSLILPVWPELNRKEIQPIKNNDSIIEKELIKNNWRCEFEQTAMYLLLPKAIKTLTPPLIELKAERLTSLESLKTWVSISSEAFGYPIEHSVLEPLINDKDVQLILAYYNHKPIATALLLKTGDVIGIHQMGIKPNAQGKGFAKPFMNLLINKCIQWQGKHIVLQASQVGKPLYDSLGFITQFTIKNYKMP